MPRRTAQIAALALLLWGALAAVAAASGERATLRAVFSPDRLGASTTISFGFHLETSDGLAPPPLRSVDLRMPAGLNYSTSTLGLAICNPALLQAKGLAGCPVNSRLGYGSAFVEVPFGTGAGQEIPEIQAVMGPPHAGNTVVLFYANGREPVSAQLVFAAEVLPASGLFGSRLTTSVPAIASVPGGPDVSIVDVHTTIGPAHLVYYHRRHGRLVPFRPTGVSVPERCPRGGFPFSAEFVFFDGSSTSAATAVPCPRRRRHR